MKRVWCEWDIDNGHRVFKSEKSARAWIDNNVHLQEMIGPEEDFQSIDEIFDLGLVRIEDLEVTK